MSQENVEVLKAHIAAWNARDLDALRELHDPHVVVRMIEGWPEPVFMGREAVMRQFEQLRDIYGDAVVVPISDFIDIGDRVLVRMIYRGSGQGPQADFEMTQVVTVCKGRIIYRQYFWDHAEALEAAGLSE